MLITIAVVQKPNNHTIRSIESSPQHPVVFKDGQHQTIASDIEHIDMKIFAKFSMV
jgi:hypothetical protein